MWVSRDGTGRSLGPVCFEMYVPVVGPRCETDVELDIEQLCGLQRETAHAWLVLSKTSRANVRRRENGVVVGGSRGPAIFHTVHRSVIYEHLHREFSKTMIGLLRFDSDPQRCRILSESTHVGGRVGDT